MGDDRERAGESTALDLRALSPSGALPLCEIAAAERERMWRIEAARAASPSVYSPDSASRQRVLH